MRDGLASLVPNAGDLDINCQLGFGRPDILAVAPSDMNLAWNETAQSKYIQHFRHGGGICPVQHGKTRNRSGDVRLVGGTFASINVDTAMRNNLLGRICIFNCRQAAYDRIFTKDVMCV